MIESLVIIPTYNEKENIQKIIKAVFNLLNTFHVLVIDDNSSDGTSDLVKQLMPQFPESLHLVQRQGKMGLGTAYIHGFKWALERNYQYIFEMDADFSHNPADLQRLLDACKNGGADVAVGSRYINGVNVVNWPIGRVIMSYYASVYVRLITRMPVRDATAGFKCYKRSVLETLDLSKIKFMGYAFQIEMKFAAWCSGFRIIEVPIIFTDRTEGKSKMSSGIFKEAFFGVIQMKIKSWFSKYTL
ncbi:MAG: polyprenol monophosphomannose synthase [Bacteroidetes bacterium]|mgnify:FL=1|nr:polyprenol monophosphomannose synthase [Bacteroidota bacterium]MBX7239392.1 polyprenol monophosphomannose synthase [Bacteroidia bacterium]MCC7513495.1 polyprenol monophosphomannose synthase [Bacteroidia bacterium]MCW5918896.1 polyprenol monophosphomannose synthase [Bacteroidota bacterium]HCI57712.1 dolichyl-phosphate beta-D-mannosyltransferase [Bacteroidota bacterium]